MVQNVVKTNNIGVIYLLFFKKLNRWQVIYRIKKSIVSSITRARACDLVILQTVINWAMRQEAIKQ
jgi:hypothetical protein